MDNRGFIRNRIVSHWNNEPILFSRASGGFPVGSNRNIKDSGPFQVPARCISHARASLAFERHSHFCLSPSELAIGAFGGPMGLAAEVKGIGHGAEFAPRLTSRQVPADRHQRTRESAAATDGQRKNRWALAYLNPHWPNLNLSTGGA
jgi:hypothetical protein